MFNNILYSLNVIAYLGLAVLLVFICFRTRSKGLILISAILLTGGIFNWIFEQGIDFYMERWIAREVVSDGVWNMNAGEFLMGVALVKPLLYRCLCLIGGFFVYREWRLGKFRNLQPEHLEESMA